MVKIKDFFKGQMTFLQNKVVNKFPSSKEIIEEARRKNPKADINKLHAVTYDLIIQYRQIYYQNKVKNLLRRPLLTVLPEKVRLIIKKELLKPIKVKDKKGKVIVYSNFMEEASRRISQTFQVISGNLAELCAEQELLKAGLKPKVNYQKRKERADLVIYHPKLPDYSKMHRIEVKNVKLRERATRGFIFDGDSMIGFFDDPSEFTDSNIEIFDYHCKKTGGYCYIPPAILGRLKGKMKNKRFKSNKDFASDMVKFVKTGSI